MTKVVALEPFVGSYVCAKGETPDYVQNETRAAGDMGELVKVQVGYRSVRVTLGMERAATPGEVQDDQARIARDGEDASRIVRHGGIPILLVPGTVSMGGITIEGAPGRNPAFDVPEAVARAWVTRGLVRLYDEAAPAETAGAAPVVPPADPRMVSKRRLTAEAPPA